MQNRAIIEQVVMMLRSTTSVDLITLGFMTFKVWHERDSGIAGAEYFGDFLKRELKSD